MSDESDDGGVEAVRAVEHSGGTPTKAVESREEEVSLLRDKLRVLRANYDAIVEAYERLHHAKSQEVLRRNVRRAAVTTSMRRVNSGHFRASEIPSATRAGFLIKKKGSMSSFVQQRRFFVLLGNKLLYYKSKDDFKPRGMLNLYGCDVRVVSAADMCFHVELLEEDEQDKQRAYFLFADNPTACDEWVSAVADASVFSLKLESALGRPPLILSEQPTEQLSLRPVLALPAPARLNYGDGDGDGDGGGGVRVETEFVSEPPPGEQKSRLRRAVSVSERSFSDNRAFLETTVAVITGRERTLDAAEVDHLRVLLKGTAKGAAMVAQVLDAHRSTTSEAPVHDNFQKLCQIVNTSLLAAFSFDDFRSVRVLLNLANTYYHDFDDNDDNDDNDKKEKKKRRVYVIDQCRTHKAFASVRTWEEVFFDAVLAATAKEKKEHDRDAYANMAFSQLLSLSNEMMSFRKLSLATVSHFVLKMSVACNVSEEQRAMLFANLKQRWVGND